MIVNDPLFRPIKSTYYFSDLTAYIEMSSASGLSLLKKEEQNCMNTSSFGTGELIKDAINKGLTTINLYIGGSATNDGGIGIASALGFEFYDKFKKLLYPIGKKKGFDQQVIDWTTAAGSKDRHSKSINIIDATSLIGNMRLIKDEHEISLIRKACDISAEAHIEAMKSVKDGDNEQQIESMYIHEFSKRGARFPAYNPIIAGGENACVLHYVENNQNLKSSDLLLVDAGCEYQMYAADITRTFPVSGKFSEEQLQIYKIVLDAMNAAIDSVKEGNNIMQPQEISEKVITEGLVNIGLLKGDPEELHKSGAYKDFYMHKIGHWLGLDVHDAGDYTEGDEFMTFKPGMITTIEPGIYISSKMDVDDKWKGIGVRIEDDILVTKDGNENLTKKVPSDPNEIESLMS